MTASKKTFLSLNKFYNGFQNLIYSNFFPLFVSIFTVIIYFASENSGIVGGILGVSVFSILVAVILAFQQDLCPIFPLLFNAPFIFSFSSITMFENPFCYFVFLPVVVALVVRIFKYPTKIRLGVYGISLICMLSGYIFSGLFNNSLSHCFENTDKPWFSLAVALVLGVGMGAILEYVVLKHGMYSENRKSFDLKVYFAKTIIYLAFAVVFQLLFTSLKVEELRWLGWGHRNFVGFLILFAVPMCAYLIIKTEKIFPYVFAILFFIFGSIKAECDASTGIILIFSPLLIYYVYTKLSRSKKSLFLNLCLCVIIAFLIGVIYKIISDEDFINQLTIKFLTDTGRSNIYREAIRLFKENPLFGKGVYYPFENNFWWTSNYHSSFIQALATTGVYGLAMLLFTYFARIKVLTKKNTPFNVCAFFSVIFFMIHSSIDCGESLMIVIIAVGFIIVTEHLNNFNEEVLPVVYLK